MALPGQETYNAAFGGGAWQAPAQAGGSFLDALRKAEMMELERKKQKDDEDWRKLQYVQGRQDRRELIDEQRRMRKAMEDQKREKEAKGRPLGAQTAEELGDRLAIPSELERNAADVKARPELLGPENVLATKVPLFFSERKDVSSKVGAIRKLAARAIEGARLTDSDMAYYQKNLPSETDTPKEFENKTRNLVGLLSRATSERVSSLGKAGFDVSGYASDMERLAELGKQTGETGGGMDAELKPGKVEDGYQYIGGDPANPQSWKKVP